jgi:uncharacterized repeat protein (TIGR03847 family)
MPGSLFEFSRPERFVAGTVGRPGERAFFLQVRDGRRVVSVAVEKQQVALLAERLGAMLDELLRDGRSAIIPAVAPAGLEDNEPLETPVEPEFRAVALAIGWDDDEDLVLVEAQSVVADEDDDELAALTEGPQEGEADMLRVSLTAAAAREFVRRGETLVAAGRPACPFCSLPLDPEGHVCPRANGYRR